MSAPTGRYVKPAGRTYGPRAILSLVVQPRKLPGGSAGRTTPLGFGRAAAAVSYLRRGVWSEPRCESFACPTLVIPWVESQCPDRQRLHCFAPVASNALTLCQFWHLATTRGADWERQRAAGPAVTPTTPAADRMTFSRLVTRGNPDIVAYRYHGKSYQWVSGVQYLPSSEDDLARSVGFDWSSPSIVDAKGMPINRTPEDRCLLWLRLATGLADWWREVDGGPWSSTVGGLADSFFRARVTPRTVLIHGDRHARKLEASAIYGGRASVWFYGDIGPRGKNYATESPFPPRSSYPDDPGPLHHLDVRSMYPHLLATERFPVRLLTVQNGPRVDDLADLLRTCGAIANVTLEARSGEYPHRSRGRVIYPTGHFQTVLCGPELSWAIQDGAVRSVATAAVYQLGRPFRRMADELLQLRSVARDRHDPAWELFVKLLSNSFSGKLAQRYSHWTPAPDVPPQTEWGEWHTINVDTGVRRSFRAAAGLTFERKEQPDKGRSLGSCYAYLTSYGRDRMRRVRESCDPQQVYAQDTDGIWISPDGVERIKRAGHPFGESPGHLRLTGIRECGRFYTSKHYWTESGWVLSGFHQAVRTSDGLTFRDSFAVNPMSGVPSHPPQTCFGVTRELSLVAEHADGQVLPSGWCEPFAVGSPHPGGSSPPSEGGG